MDLNKFDAPFNPEDIEWRIQQGNTRWMVGYGACLCHEQSNHETPGRCLRQSRMAQRVS